jgi:threonine dehydratase
MSAEVTLDDVLAAAARIAGVLVRTPLLAPRTPGFPLADRAVALKMESLQVTGSFKPRGAFNKIAALAPEARARGLVAFSSGNHAQAVAWAARRFGVPATVVMPLDAPAAKVEGTRRLGAEVIQSGKTSQERLELGTALAAERGATLVPPYDDAFVIAGQGTLALEVIEDRPDVEALVVPVSGGGLISGVAVAAKSLRPDLRVIGVEPEGAADARASLRAGTLTTNPQPHTIADGLRAVRLGDLPWSIVRRLVDDVVTVDDDEIRAAVVALHRHAKLVVEPSGAVAVAALCAGRTGVEDRRAVAVVSGGNVDPGLLAGWLTA